MAAYWQSPYAWQRPWWGGPIADPAPSPWGYGGFPQVQWGGGVGPIADPAPWADAARAANAAAFTPAFTPIADPAPWPWGGPVYRPRVPFPFPFPWPRPGDPGPEDFVFTRGGLGGGRVPFPGPEPGDPGPADLGFQTRSFAQSLEAILRAGGLTEEQMARASVADLVGAYRASITPPVAKAAVGAFTAAQVAELDRNGLERLALLISSETDRLASLRQVVEGRAKDLKK